MIIEGQGKSLNLKNIFKNVLAMERIDSLDFLVLVLNLFFFHYCVFLPHSMLFVVFSMYVFFECTSLPIFFSLVRDDSLEISLDDSVERCQRPSKRLPSSMEVLEMSLRRGVED